MRSFAPAIAASIALLLTAGRADAQGMMPSSPPRPKANAPAPNPNEPVTHAASGASDESLRLGGTEPSLPQNPLTISPDLRARIGTDAERERERGRGTQTYRFWLPPWYSEKSDKYEFRTLFPLWAERKQPNGDRASLFGPIYYNRRSPEHDADVVFPVFWNLRDGKSRTVIVGPYVHRSAPGATDNWLAPLVFTGTRGDRGGYLHIPPLLTFTHHDDKGGFNLVGPYYCSWEGASYCSHKKASDISFGLVPFLFAGKNEKSRFELVPPLLHYFHYNEVDDRELNVWGPLVWTHSQETDSFNVFPFFWHSWGKNEDHVTVLPFFHYGYEGNSSLLINPLFLYAHGEKGESTFVTYPFARYRGRTTFDMWTPLFFRYTDPDIGLKRYIAPLPLPFYYSTSPRGSDVAILPFYAHSIRPGLSESTWVTPFVNWSHDLTGFSTNILPVFFTGRSYSNTHTVVFPFFWDFASPKSRTTVGMPLLWRFADEDTVSELVGNVYYHEKKVSGGLDWEVHVFPAFSYGENPNGHFWNVLFGLAGYSRRGANTEMRILYIPITLSEGASGGSP